MTAPAPQPGPDMTVTEALARYSYSADPAGWHRQPVCVCGDYISQHEEAEPHRCGFAAAARGVACGCIGYRYSRMGYGMRPP